MNNFFSFFIVFFLLSNAQAVVSFSTTGSAGMYRDDRQRAHFPVYYSLNYSGYHTNGVETHVDLILNNDFALNEWRTFPSQALLIIPMTDGFASAPYRKTRLEVGRSLFAEGFDLSLFDGAKTPFYWSQHGGGIVYGGWERTLDLYEEAESPLAGVSLFQDVGGYFFRAGFSESKDQFKERRTTESVMKQWDVWSSPMALYKVETDMERGFVQALSELSVSPINGVALTGRHSYRNPRRVAENENIFLYKIFAQSPVETYQGAINFELNPDLSVEVSESEMRYQAGRKFARGGQQELNVLWQLGPRTSLRPVVRHLESYGGVLWDSGLTFRTGISRKINLQADFAAAYFDKVNGISAYAYQQRDGFEFLLAPRLTAMTWIEVERNHLYVFDTRAFANVTYFQ